MARDLTIRTAILGAAGILGQVFIDRLASHPDLDISALVDVTPGEPYENTTKWRLGSDMPTGVGGMKICSLESLSTKDIDLVLSALPGGVAGPIELDLARKGFFIISKASDHRMEEDVPLLIPEVNEDHLSLIEKQRKKRGWKGAIITDPNCSTTILAMSLKPLWDRFGVEKVAVTTMQAISGAGYPGVPSLDMLDNVIPYISGEEEKMVAETKKLLGSPEHSAQICVAASCNRVSTTDGHLESVFVATSKRADANDVKETLRQFKGLDLHSAPKQPIIVRDEPNRPQTRLDRDAGKGMSVVVGRVRNDEVFGLAYTVLGHNTHRGGAGGAVLVAELCHRKGYL